MGASNDASGKVFSRNFGRFDDVCTFLCAFFLQRSVSDEWDSFNGRGTLKLEEKLQLWIAIKIIYCCKNNWRCYKNCQNYRYKCHSCAIKEERKQKSPRTSKYISSWRFVESWNEAMMSLSSWWNRVRNDATIVDRKLTRLGDAVKVWTRNGSPAEVTLSTCGGSVSTLRSYIGKHSSRTHLRAA